MFEKGFTHEIFIGLKDQDTYQEIFSVNDFRNILTAICTEREICFSLITQLGGYTHNKGYTTETSLRVVIVGATDEEIAALGAWLKAKINTDTILITKTEVEFAFM